MTKSYQIIPVNFTTQLEQKEIQVVPNNHLLQIGFRRSQPLHELGLKITNAEYRVSVKKIFANQKMFQCKRRKINKCPLGIGIQLQDKENMNKEKYIDCFPQRTISLYNKIAFKNNIAANFQNINFYLNKENFENKKNEKVKFFRYNIRSLGQQRDAVKANVCELQEKEKEMQKRVQRWSKKEKERVKKARIGAKQKQNGRINMKMEKIMQQSNEISPWDFEKPNYLK